MSAKRRGKSRGNANRKSSPAFVPQPAPQLKLPEKSVQRPQAASEAFSVGIEREPWNLRGLSQETDTLSENLDTRKAIDKHDIPSSETTINIKTIKWIAVFMGCLAITAFWKFYDIAHRAAQVESDVASLQKTTDALRSDFKELTLKLSGSIKDQAASAAKLRDSIDRVEKAVAQRKPGP